MISDHGQTELGTTNDYSIYLDNILADFKIHQLGKEVQAEDEVVNVST
ncbi:hypothetical protein JNUCC42_09755 [Brevibacterium sp. JNUCC-42]|nr:hypothetical protein JNUCC42_09755 [Brevibacterium sp. JNUCC-42]